MRICAIVGSLPPEKCGVGDYSRILFNMLSNELDINIITSIGFGNVNDKFKIHPIMNDWTLKEASVILKKIQEINPDIIHIQYPTTAYKRNILINFLPILLRIKRYKIIVTLHEYSYRSLFGKLRIWPNIIASNKIIVVDPIYKDDILKNFMFRKKKIEFINIGSNIPKSNISKEKRNNIRKNIIGDDNFYLMSYFGFINETKGIPSIIEAMNVLKNNNNLFTKLLLIGELDKNNVYHEYLLNLIENYNLNDYIQITGYLEESKVADYLSISDFCILPYTDGLSIKNGSFLAAYQEGLPVITTKPDNNTLKFGNVYFIPKSNNELIISRFIELFQKQKITNVNTKDMIPTWDKIVKDHINIYNRNFKVKE